MLNWALLQSLERKTRVNTAADARRDRRADDQGAQDMIHGGDTGRGAKGPPTLDVPRQLRVVFLATGDDRQHQMLAISRANLARYHPELRQVVISDRPIPSPGVDRGRAESMPACATPLGKGTTSTRHEVIRVEALGGYASRTYKTRLNTFARTDMGLFLDNDAVVIARLDELWPYLDQAPVALALEDHETVGAAVRAGLAELILSEEEADFTLSICVDDQPHFNTGVLLWRHCPAIDTLFQTWHQEWMRYRRRDQFAFSRALALTGVPIATLPPAYNTPVLRAFEPHEITGVRILHFWRPPKLVYMQKLGVTRYDGPVPESAP